MTTKNSTFVFIDENGKQLHRAECTMEEAQATAFSLCKECKENIELRVHNAEMLRWERLARYEWYYDTKLHYGYALECDDFHPYTANELSEIRKSAQKGS